jgi:hypothetical protein
VISTASATSRIAPEYWTTADGGVWFKGWHDDQLQTDCDFIQVENDWRCIPHTNDTTLLYADAACSQPITEVPATDGCGVAVRTPGFVREVVATEAGSSTQIRRVLTPRPLQATVYDKTDAGCEGRAVSADKAYFDVSLPMPTSQFVKGWLVLR